MERPNFSLLERVEAGQVPLDCPHCGSEGIMPILSESGKHIRADCSVCGSYIRFVRQVLPPEERAYWDERKRNR